jgi:transposase
MGFLVRLIPTQQVKALAYHQKNDALVICETALRAGIHFVAVKTGYQGSSKRTSVDGRATYCFGKSGPFTGGRTRD